MFVVFHRDDSFINDSMIAEVLGNCKKNHRKSRNNSSQSKSLILKENSDYRFFI